MSGMDSYVNEIMGSSNRAGTGGSGSMTRPVTGDTEGTGTSNALVPSSGGTCAAQPDFSSINDGLDDIMPLTEESNELKDCYDNCKDLQKLKEEECDKLRKRVAEFLKQRGCPSKVTAYKKRSSSKCSKKKSSSSRSTRSTCACRR